jgi:stage V sporulation protein SpoVS
MAGKTLTGIGEDESGKHELAADQSDSGVRQAKLPEAKPLEAKTPEPKPPSNRPTDPMPLTTARPTDRMPLSTIIGAAPFFGLPDLPAVAAPAIDEDKVAEGLKKLRSLDEPLGPIPSTMQTLKEGIPAFGVGPPTPANPAAIAAVAASDLLRSRGTAHGHALSAGGVGQAVQALSIDDRMKGTLLGHSLHLPDAPEVAEEISRPAEVRSIARAAPTGALTPAEMNTDFSHGDARFFDSEPVVSHEYEPERPRANKTMIRGLIAGGVASVLIVAAVAWFRSPNKTESTAPPIEAQTPTQATPPPAQEPPPVPAPDPAAAPAADPPAPVVAAPPPPRPQPEEAPPAAVVAPAAAPTPARPHAHHEAPVLASKPAGHSAAATTPTHAARPGAPARVPTKPAVPGKHAKVADDPDGTLPLDE